MPLFDVRMVRSGPEGGIKRDLISVHIRAIGIHEDSEVSETSGQFQ